MNGPHASRSHPQAAGLSAGLAALGLGLTDGQIGQLLAYLDLILKWNKVYNLTAVRDPAEMLTHHLLDSLAIISPLRRYTGGRPARVLDVGAGAGLPGVVVAICCPEISVTCVDAVAKKVAFMRQVAAVLKLETLHSTQARIEQLPGLPGAYDVVCSRAFAALADFTAWSAAALAAQGVWLAMKGRRPDDEIAALPPGVVVFHVEPLTVPRLKAERCIVWLRKAGHPERCQINDETQ